MKKNFLCNLLLVFFLLACNVMDAMAAAATSKREFRGAWIQAVNGQFQGMPPAAMQQTLSYQLDELQKDALRCAKLAKEDYS
mgnify:CR=1 FL=1